MKKKIFKNLLVGGFYFFLVKGKPRNDGIKDVNEELPLTKLITIPHKIKNTP